MSYSKHSKANSGTTIRNNEKNYLELDSKVLQYDDWVELQVFGYWIPGRVEHDTGGWYLMTLDNVGIRLRAGLTARFCQPITSVSEPIQYRESRH